MPKLIYRVLWNIRAVEFTNECNQIRSYYTVKQLTRTVKLQRVYPFLRKCCNYICSNSVYLSQKQQFETNPKKKYPSDHTLLRPKTKQPSRLLQSEEASSNTHVCYTLATADHYRFSKLVDYMVQDIRFQEVKLPMDISNAAVCHSNHASVCRNDGDAYIIIFREGTISFWNVSDAIIKETLRLVRKYEVESYKVHLIKWESEQMEYKFVSGQSRFSKNCFEVSSNGNHVDTCSVLYTFSNALSISVKLAHWEHSLDQLIQSIESLPRALMKGSLLRNQTPKLVLQKLGVIFMIRHRLNLQYNLLDVPDVYWDREEMEQLYTKTSEFLNISRRVKVMNEKLSYCAHMMELVKSHMTEQKSMRIEILIVLLILIEVLFEVIHFYVQPYFATKQDEECTTR